MCDFQTPTYQQSVQYLHRLTKSKLNLYCIYIFIYKLNSSNGFPILEIGKPSSPNASGSELPKANIVDQCFDDHSSTQRPVATLCHVF